MFFARSTIFNRNQLRMSVCIDRKMHSSRAFRDDDRLAVRRESVRAHRVLVFEVSSIGYPKWKWVDEKHMRMKTESPHSSLPATTHRMVVTSVLCTSLSIALSIVYCSNGTPAAAAALFVVGQWWRIVVKTDFATSSSSNKNVIRSPIVCQYLSVKCLSVEEEIEKWQ